MIHTERISNLQSWAIENGLVPIGEHIVAWDLCSNSDQYYLVTANLGEKYPFRSKIYEHKENEYQPFKKSAKFEDKPYQAVWIIENRFILGQGYKLQAPDLVNIKEGYRRMEYQNISGYPAYKIINQIP